MTTTRQKSEPFVKRNHIDGPVLVRSDGQMVWLNWRERVRVALGLTNAARLEKEIGDPRKRF